MKKITLLIGFAFIWLLQPVVVHAQFWEAGVSAGASTYLGDISAPLSKIAQHHPAAGAFVRGTFGGVFSARLGFEFGSISGDDRLSNVKGHIDRNLSFTSEIQEAHVMFDINLFSFNPCKNKNFSPYITFGAAYFHFDPKTSYHGQLVRLQPLGTEGQGVAGYNRTKYQLFQPSFPIGGGFKYAINNRLVFALELAGRKTLTDYLDDVSTTYINSSLLAATNSQTAADVAYRGVKHREPDQLDRLPRGNPAKKDWYVLTQMHLTYIFSSKCKTGEYRGRIYIGRSQCFKF